ncbi:Galacturonosyltransferase 8 [Raphanus sativus]|nr:Galacturonosyltransferase 8 [Raphanus sativus]
MRLMEERIAHPEKYTDKDKRAELEDPSLYHYAIFSDNVIAASVVVNSAVMFKLKEYKGAHVEVKAVEDYTFLNSSYVPVLKQLESSNLQKFYFENKLENATKDTTNMKLGTRKGLTGLWEIDMDGKVNGSCGDLFRLVPSVCSVHELLPSFDQEKFNPKACAWAYGMNFFDLDAWRREKCTEEYHYWAKPGKTKKKNCDTNENRALWKLGTLPPGLITFYSTTKPLDKSWHVLGLGYNPSISMEEIRNAAVVHFNGNMKPWLDIAMNQFRPLWTKHVDYDLEFVQALQFRPLNYGGLIFSL